LHGLKEKPEAGTISGQFLFTQGTTIDMNLPNHEWKTNGISYWHFSIFTPVFMETELACSVKRLQRKGLTHT